MGWTSLYWAREAGRAWGGGGLLLLLVLGVALDGVEIGAAAGYRLEAHNRKLLKPSFSFS